MLPEKLAAQTGHAFVNSLDNARALNPDIDAQYKGTGNGTKITMYGKTENQLIRAFDEAVAAGIPCDLIIDRGDILPPHFDGQPIITAVGIGPVHADMVKFITKRFSMHRQKPAAIEAPAPEITT